MCVCAYVYSRTCRHLRKNLHLIVPISPCQTANPWKKQQENNFAETSLTSEHERGLCVKKENKKVRCTNQLFC